LPWSFISLGTRVYFTLKKRFLCYIFVTEKKMDSEAGFFVLGKKMSLHEK
jgi:hypothetical protein